MVCYTSYTPRVTHRERLKLLVLLHRIIDGRHWTKRIDSRARRKAMLPASPVESMSGVRFRFEQNGSDFCHGKNTVSQ